MNHYNEKNTYEKHFRVAIFGSARITEDDDTYKDIYELAKLFGADEIDVVTGGGPGIMEAASSGHHAGRTNHLTRTIGLNIVIPAEQQPNRHLDIKKDFERFSERLDNFMLLSDAVVVAPGGVGTLLELCYTWQLVQVEHIGHIPIILLGDLWKNFLLWVKDNPLKLGYLSEEDYEQLFFAKDVYEAHEIISKYHELYQRGDDSYQKLREYMAKNNGGEQK